MRDTNTNNHPTGTNDTSLSSSSAAQPPFACSLCRMSFKDAWKRDRHAKRQHFSCSACAHIFETEDELGDHIHNEHLRHSVPLLARAVPHLPLHTEFAVCEQAFRGSVKCYRHIPSVAVSPADLLPQLAEQIRNVIANETQLFGSVKWYICAHVELSRSTQDGLTESATIPIRSTSQISFSMSDFDGDVNAAIEKIAKTLDEIELRGSGWTLTRTASLDIHIVKHQPLVGSAFIPLPNELKHKNGRSLINVQNVDTRCFRYSVLAALHCRDVHREDRFTAAAYDRFEGIDFGSLDEPMVITSQQLKSFEAANDMSVNIYGFERDTVFPIHVSTARGGRRVDLLHISKSDRFHFVAIRSLEGLLKEQGSNHFRAVCRLCLHQFHSVRERNDHQVDCATHKVQRVTFPEPGSKIKFTGHHKQQRVGSIVYADLESILVPTPPDQHKGVLQRHEVCSAAALMVSDDPQTERRRFLEREKPDRENDIGVNDDSDDEIDEQHGDVLPHFFNFLFDCANVAYTASRKKIVMSAADEEKFQESSECWICEQKFGVSDVKTRDHDHMSEFIVW
jgi:hypothetical protein